ncbi:MAG: hypothetical protein ACRYG8_53955, partial [Janthinobacterium lividum]
MTDDTINEILSAARKRRYGTRGAFYRLLRSGYREIAACLVQDEPTWRDIADAMAQAGIVGRVGNPPNRKSLQRVWQRVCQDIAAEEAMRLTGMKPSKASRRKLPANWLPSGYPQPNAPSPTGDEHQGSAPAALPAVPHHRPASPATTEPTAGDQRPAPGSFAAARELLNLRSGRKANGEPVF